MATAKQTKSQLLDDYKFVFSSEEGQRVLNDLLTKAMVAKPIFDTDTNLVYSRIGAQEVGLYLLSVLKYDIKDFIFDEIEREEVDG